VGVERRDKDMMVFFVDDKLLNGERLLQRSPAMRERFVEFIKSCAWTDKLRQLEDNPLGKMVDDSSVWSKYGYKPPNFPSPRKVVNSYWSDKSSDVSVNETEADSVYPATVPEDATMDMTNSDVFGVDGLRSVLFAVLLPIFLSNPDLVQESASSKGLLGREGSRLSFKKRSERLQDWFIGAAAMADSAHLNECLSDAAHSWVADFKNLVAKFPATIYLSLVNDTEVESKVVFCNSVDKVLFREQTAVGANLHDIFSLRCSAHDADLVHRAVFGGKPLKLCMMTDSCTLRALKPVRDARGKLKYMIGIESRAFPYPVDDSAVCEKPFHEMELVLNLLPLLVKFPLYV